MTHLSHDSYIQKRDEILKSHAYWWGDRIRQQLFDTPHMSLEEAAKAIDDLVLELVESAKPADTYAKPDEDIPFHVGHNYGIEIYRLNTRAIVQGSQDKTV